MAPDPILFFGRLHPLFVHLPIGFLTLLTIVELARRHRWFAASAQARGIIVLVTAASAVASVLLGLMLSTGGGYDPELLWWHKWMGILLAIGTISAGIAFYAKRPRWYAGFLIGTIGLLGPASHLGGSMTHGKNYLFAYAPMWMRPAPASQPVARVTAPVKSNDLQTAEIFGSLVQPMFQQSCLGCHNADRTSGGLRLESYDLLLHGGKDGPAIIAKNSIGSAIVQRILLPHEDSRHMPPSDKPQLSDDQVTLLQWWIDSGAGEHATVADSQPTHEQLVLASRLLKLPMPGEAPSVPPVALADLTPLINTVAEKTGVIISQTAIDQPWLIVNASLLKSFGDAEVAQLAPLANNIVDLNLAGTSVTDSGLATVGAMPNLQRLRLDRAAITDRGMAHLTVLTKLEYLNLYGTAITGVGLKTLAPMAGLRHIYVWKTGVDPAAAASFTSSRTDKAKAVEIQKQIEKLQQELANQKIEVVEGVGAATQPATARATTRTTRPSTAP